MLPSALEHIGQIIVPRGQSFVLFLDYDGTLTPIVDLPERAELADSIRQIVRALADRAPVAVLSGRDLDDLRRRVKIDRIIYAGSHGFDLLGPGELRKEMGVDFLPLLDFAESELREKLARISGALVERKRFSVAAHYRNVGENDCVKLARIVNEIAARHRQLRKIENKKVYELQPDVNWNKGKAVTWILRWLGKQQLFPIYIGDDQTDEDAFLALEKRGAGILVSEQPPPTSARYTLKNPAEVERFLRELLALMPLKS